MFSYNKQYIDGLTKTYGFHKEYQFKGKKCHKDCRNLKNYETIHSMECPFYKGSFSEKFYKLLEYIKYTEVNGDLKEVDFIEFCKVRNKLHGLGIYPFTDKLKY